MTSDEIIQEIIKILRIDGELATDGQCLELVSELLDKTPYGPVFQTVYRTGDLGEYGKAYDATSD
jgi:hypothetical protein